MKSFFSLILLITGLSLQAQMPNTLSPQQKVYGLSKFWQEVNYNFVFYNRVDRKEWDSLYQAMIMEVQASPNDYEYYKKLEQICAYLEDGHTNIYYPQTVSEKMMTTMFGNYRLFLTNFDGKAIITRVNQSKKDEIPAGSEIITVNGMSTADYIAQYVRPYIASSTDYVRENQCVYQLLKGFEGQEFTITIKKPNGSTQQLTLTHARTEEQEIYPPFEDFNLLSYKSLENDIAYLQLNSFENESLDSLFQAVLPEIYKAKAVIIDLRNNGGGSTYIGLNVLKYFVADTLMYGSRSESRMHIPTYKAWGAFLTPTDTLQDNPDWGMTKEDMTKSYLMANDNYYYQFDYYPDTIQMEAKRMNVPTVVLTSNNTASAAEDFLIYADGYKHITKIGSPTYGSTGQPYLFDLPGGGRARICTKNDTYPDGRQFIGYGIVPDIAIKQSLQDYLNNNDVVLQKAIEVLNTQLK
ncbi:MAG: peptidase S41 [Bacteroidetes bacterium]|jgi:C-terminal processing protease CtpA/Prc|nr:peptidase S41 [Bacteroidota bacterium]